MKYLISLLLVAACGDNIHPVDAGVEDYVNEDIRDRFPGIPEADTPPVVCEPGVPQEYCPDAGVEPPCEDDDTSCHWHGNHWHCDKNGHEHNGKWHQGHLE